MAQRTARPAFGDDRARQVGISVRTIARLEAGTRVSDETLKAIAGALNVALDALSEVAEREPELGEEEERKRVREVIAERKLNAIPVTLRRADRGGHDLVEALNATHGFVPHYDPPSKVVEEDAIAQFFGALDDWVLGWPDLPLSDRFTARRQFDDMLEQLREVGYRLYLGRVRHVWWQGTDKEMRMPMTVTVLSKRTISRFVGLVPRGPDGTKGS